MVSAPFLMTQSTGLVVSMDSVGEAPARTWSVEQLPLEKLAPPLLEPLSAGAAERDVIGSGCERAGNCEGDFVGGSDDSGYG